MSETTFTFRVDEALKIQFTEAAKHHDRASSQLLRDFMRNFVKQDADEAEYDRWFHQQVHSGLREANNNHLRSQEDVEAKFSALRAKTLRKYKGIAE